MECRYALVARIYHIFYLQMIPSSFVPISTSASKIKNILYQFELASGQVVNFQKSGIFYSNNSSASLRSYLNSVMGVYNNIDHGRYLGLPSLVDSSKRKIFEFLRNKLRTRLTRWNNR